MQSSEQPALGPLGSTWYQGGTIDSNNLAGTHLEGKWYDIPDIDPTAAPGAAPRTNRMKRIRIVRNVSGIALLPKRIVRYQKTAGNIGDRVDGYTRLDAEDFAGVVDEYLPAAGVPNNDLFYMVESGPAVFLTDIAASANNLISIGDRLVSLTAATSQATTAGRVKKQDLTGATAILGDNVQNCLGVAMTARTTDNTNADILVDLLRRF